MPVKITCEFERGWKRDENQRVGLVWVVNFFNEETGELMFTFAPKLEHKPVFNYLFKVLDAYDAECKKLMKWVEMVDKENPYHSGFVPAGKYDYCKKEGEK